MTCAEKTAWLQAANAAGSAIASAGTAMSALKAAASARKLERAIRLREQLAVEIGRLTASLDSAEEKKKAYLEWLRKDAARLVEGRRRETIDSIASMRGHSEVTSDPEVVEAVARMREAAAANDEAAFGKAYEAAVKAADKAWKPQSVQEKATASAMTAINAEHTCGRTDPVNDTNPNYGKNTYPEQWDWNCQRCVPAAALVKMGWLVEAKPCLGTNDPWKYEWDNVFVGMQNSYTRWNTRTELENLMRSWGDGAIAEVYVEWKGGNAHVFMAEQIDGKTVFTCPQTHDPNYDPFPHVQRGSGRAYRIDDKTPNPALVERYFSKAKK